MLHENLFYQQDEITPLTMAVVPNEITKEKPRSCRIFEETGERTVNLTSKQVLDKSCRFFGSSLRGRIEGTASIVGITHKPPIIIDSPLGMVFFPTSSPHNINCIWLSHSHIEKIVEEETKETSIYFINGETLILAISYHSLKNQIIRTAQFRFALENRKPLTNNRQNKRQFINPFAKEPAKNSFDELILQME